VAARRDGLEPSTLRLTDACRSLIGPRDVGMRRSPGGVGVRPGAARCGQNGGHAVAARRPAWIAKAENPLDPQDVGVGIYIGQSVCRRRAGAWSTCGLFAPAQDVWSPNGPQARSAAYSPLSLVLAAVLVGAPRTGDPVGVNGRSASHPHCRSRRRPSDHNTKSADSRTAVSVGC